MTAQCGTNSGYQAHRRKKEIACDECLKAHRIVNRTKRSAKYRTANKDEPIWHGTNAGYMRHRRRDEAPCDECVEAHRQAGEAYNALNKIG